MSYKEKYRAKLGSITKLSTDIYNDFDNNSEYVEIDNSVNSIFIAHLKKQPSCCSTGVLHDFSVRGSDEFISTCIDFCVKNIKKIRKEYLEGNEEIEKNAFTLLMISHVDGHIITKILENKKNWKELPTAHKNAKTGNVVRTFVNNLHPV